MTCAEGEQLLERQFVEGLSPVEGASLRAHVATCERCRRAQQQLARVDEALYGAPLSPQRVEQLEAELLGGAVRALPVRRARGAALAITAAALAASLAALVWWRAGPGDEFQPRGAVGSGVGLQALCVRADGTTRSSAKPGQTLPCAPGDVVQLMYSAKEPVRVTVRTSGGAELVASPGLTLDAAASAALPLSTPVGPWLSGPTELQADFAAAASGKPLATLRLTLTPTAP